MIRTPWYHGWNVIALTMIYQAIVMGFTLYCYPFVAVSWIEEFGTSRRDVMVSVTAASLIMGFAAPFAGKALDRYSPRLIIGSGALAYAAGLLLVARATTQWQIAVIYALLIPAGLVLTSILSAQWLVARWFVERRGLAMGISALGTSIGGLALPPLVTMMIPSIGWRNTFDVFAAITLLVVVPLIYTVLSVKTPAHDSQGASGLTNSPHDSNAPVWSTATILANRNFWIIVAIFIPIAFIYTGTQLHLGSFATEIGVRQQHAAFAVSFLSVIMMGAKITFGRLADSYDHRVLSLALIGASILAAASFATASGIAGLIVGAVFLGIANGGYLPLMSVIVSTRFGTANFGQVMGTLMIFGNFGVFGGITSGWIREWTGSYAIAYLSLIVMVIPGALSFWFLQAKATPR